MIQEGIKKRRNRYEAGTLQTPVAFKTYQSAENYGMMMMIVMCEFQIYAASLINTQ